MDSKKQNSGFATKAIHSSNNPSKWGGKSASTFKENPQDGKEEYLHGGNSNATRDTLENCLASLENAKYGVTFGSGLAAITAVFNLLRPGHHVIISNSVYGGTTQLVKEVFMRFGIEFTFINFVECGNFEKVMKPKTKMVFIETPTNPLLHVLDIESIARSTHMQSGTLLVVDNTFTTPYLQRPLDLDADITVTSLSKYMNGHSDVIMGFVATNCKSVYKKLRTLQTVTGGGPSTLDCYQMLRSIKTLSLRMDQHGKSALCVAKFLEGNKFVEKVSYPGLKSHRQHELNRRQSYGSSGIVSFWIKGRLKQANKFLNSLKLFQLAISFGACQSLAQLPYTMTHGNLSPEAKQIAGITENLISLSVGLEDAQDIVADLDQALKASQK